VEASGWGGGVGLRLACALACLWLVVGCGQPDGAPRAAELLTPAERAWVGEHGGRLRLGPGPLFPPFSFFDDGAYSGIGGDYVRLLESRLGIRFVLVRLPSWGAVARAFERREIDVVPAATPTSQRERFLDFTDPYVETPSVLVGRLEEKRLVGLEDLAGAELLAVDGYSNAQYVAEKFPAIRLRTVPDVETGLRQVSGGGADLFIIQDASFMYYAPVLGLSNLHVVGNTRHLSRQSFATRNDWPVLGQVIAKGLASITPDERKAIYQRWVHVGPAPFYQGRTFRVALGVALAVILLCLAAVFAWNRALRRQVAVKTLELQRREQQLWQARKMEAVGGMAGGLAHDFNNFLTVIRSGLGIIEEQLGAMDDRVRPEVEGSLRVADRASRSAAELVRELMEFARPATPAAQAVDLNQVAERAAALCRATADPAVTLAVRPHPAPALVTGDASQLERVLLNLCVNGVHAMTIMRPNAEAAGGTLTLEVEPDGPAGWAVAVTDTGVGMDEETLERVFEPFFSRKSRGSGTGLGLAVAYTLVRQHRGNIEVRSRPGQGTRFRVRLPARGSTSAA
jgi:signal transduction histidine kinase